MKIKHLILAFAAATLAFASCDKPTPVRPGGGTDQDKDPVVETLTIAEFIAKADTQTEYQIVGTLITDATNGSFKGFDMSDETGSITVAFPTNIDDFLSDLTTGAVATVVGKYQYYEKKGTHQLSNGTIKSVVSGKEPEVVEATCQEVIESADPLVIYKVSGKVGGPINTTYGNFDIIDETGSLYVYGVTNWAEYKDKVAENGAIVLQGKYQFYNGTKHELVNATILSFEPSTDPVIKVAASTSINYDALEAEVSFTVNNPVAGQNVTITDIKDGGFATVTLEAAAVKVVFAAANETENAKEVSFTLKYEGAADVACTVTQKVKPSENEVKLSFPDDNKTQISAYTETWTAAIGSNTWTIVNFNNNKWGNDWTYIKCGRKSDASIASITNDQKIEATKIVIKFGKILSTDKVNSAKIYVSETSDFTGADSVDITLNQNSEVEVAVSNKGFYKIEFDCQSHGSSNGIITIETVTYIK